MNSPDFSINKLLVCLDLSAMDETLLRYARYAAETFHPELVTFMHVVDAYDIPDEISEILSGYPVPVEDMLRSELHDRIEKFYGGEESVKYQVHIQSGFVVESIIDYARSNNPDLTLMGKKTQSEGEGSVAKNVLGLIPSSVLLITDITRHEINRIMVRTNFARPSVLAFQMASLVAKHTHATIEFHHVYKLPYNYFSDQTPKTLAKVRCKMNPYMEKKYAKFIKKFQIQEAVGFSYSLDFQNDEARSLCAYAAQKEVDMIVTGTRLRTQLAHVIMDSTSAKLAAIEKNNAVLIVKDAKDTVGFLTALFD